MGIYLDRARELRSDTNVHYNCAQAAFVPFAERAGLDAEQAFAVAQGFGGGMQTGNVCGAVTGAIMALGVMGIADRKTVAALIRRVRDNHEGTITCTELLRKNAQAGRPKKPHCDDMVFETVSLVEEFLEAREEA